MKSRITKRAVDDLRRKAKSEGRTLYLRDDELTGFGAISTKAGATSDLVEYQAWRSRYSAEAHDDRQAWRADAR